MATILVIKKKLEMLFFWRKHREKLERWKNRHKLTHQAYTSDCYLIAMKAPFPVWTPVLLSYGKVFTFFFLFFLQTTT